MKRVFEQIRVFIAFPLVYKEENPHPHPHALLFSGAWVLHEQWGNAVPKRARGMLP